MTTQASQGSTPKQFLAKFALMAVGMCVIGYLIHTTASDQLDKFLEKRFKDAEQQIVIEQPAPVVNMPEAQDKTLKNLTYFELSLLMDAEIANFIRSYNHQVEFPTQVQKTILKEQARRLSVISAFREEVWVKEQKGLGEHADDFSSLKPVLDKLIDLLDADAKAPKPIGETELK